MKHLTFFLFCGVCRVHYCLTHQMSVSSPPPHPLPQDNQKCLQLLSNVPLGITKSLPVENHCPKVYLAWLFLWIHFSEDKRLLNCTINHLLLYFILMRQKRNCTKFLNKTGRDADQLFSGWISWQQILFLTQFLRLSLKGAWGEHLSRKKVWWVAFITNIW